MRRLPTYGVQLGVGHQYTHNQRRAMSTSLGQLHEGDLCRFTYRRQSGNNRWYKWECTAVFLEANPKSYLGDVVVISYRPLMGTSQIPRGDLLEVEKLVDHTERTGDRGSPDVRLPRRVPGPALEVSA